MELRICYPFLYNLLFSIFVPFSSSFPLSSGNQANTPPEVSSVLIPPIIKYWSLPSTFAQHNVTLKDDQGRKWSCTTYRQSHCVPLFNVSDGLKTIVVPVTKPEQTKGNPTTRINPHNLTLENNEINKQEVDFSENAQNSTLSSTDEFESASPMPEIVQMKKNSTLSQDIVQMTENSSPTPEIVQMKENSTRSNSEITKESEETRTNFIDVEENADIVPPQKDLFENNLEIGNGFEGTKVDSGEVRQTHSNDEAINSKAFFHDITNNKQGKSIDQTDPNEPKLIVNESPTLNIPSVEKSSSFLPRSPTEENHNKPVANDQTRVESDPTPTLNLNRIKLTTANEGDDLQYITVYYRQDDEKKAAEEIHRKLESIINNTNTDLISILQSYGFTGDPYSFEAPTTPIPYNSEDDDKPKISTTMGSKNKDSSQTQDDYVNSDSSLITQGEVLQIPLNDLQGEEETNDASSQVSFKIFTYNKTKNFLETHTDGDNNQIQMDKMHESDIIQSQNRNKIFHPNRFVPRRFDEIPKAGIVDIKTESENGDMRKNSLLDLITINSKPDSANESPDDPFASISLNNRKNSVSSYKTTNLVNASTSTKRPEIISSDNNDLKPNATNNEDLPWYPDFIGSQTTTTSTRKITSHVSTASSTSTTIPTTRKATHLTENLVKSTEDHLIVSTTDYNSQLPIIKSTTDEDIKTKMSKISLKGDDENETLLHNRTISSLSINRNPTDSRSEPRKLPVGEATSIAFTSSTTTSLPLLPSINNDETQQTTTDPIRTTILPTIVNANDSIAVSKSNDGQNNETTLSAIRDEILTIQEEYENSSIEITTIIEHQSSHMTSDSGSDKTERNKQQPSNPDANHDNESFETSTEIIVQGSSLLSSTNSSSTLSTSSSTLYPFVKDQVESSTTHFIEGFALFEYPKYYNKAQAFTVYGESCYDLCEKRGYSYTWCHKFEESSNGYWSKADVCTNDSTRTPYRENCIDDCAKREYDYFWCHTGTLTWDYCTPESLLKYLEKRRSQ